MKGVYPSICTHHIYIKEGCKPVRQPYRRMNPTLKDIVKEELQKLLYAGFIYPISDSEWVSTLILVLKKNGKWIICLNYHHHHHHTYRRSEYFPEDFKKVKPPTFDQETKKSEDVKAWLLGMKKLLRLHNYLENMKAKIATFSLKGKANI